MSLTWKWVTDLRVVISTEALLADYSKDAKRCWEKDYVLGKAGEFNEIEKNDLVKEADGGRGRHVCKNGHELMYNK